MPDKHVYTLKHSGWNTFDAQTTKSYSGLNFGPSVTVSPSRRRFFSGSERTIIASIYTRIAVDVASTTFEHVRTDAEGRYLETIDSGLNDCLNVEANVDQTGFDLMLDFIYSILQEGQAALVPIDTTTDPTFTRSFDINTMRVGKVLAHHPRYVDLEVYNDKNGTRQQVTMPKESVAIVQNPFYAVMNEPNSTLKRLTHKLNLLDQADEQSVSSDLDLIIQLPYTVKNEMKRQQAQTRLNDLTDQLKNSQYGIGYIDATEKVTQLNRPVENNLLDQINDLTNQLYSQLSLDATVMNGTANDTTMNNYFQRTVAPLIQVVKAEMTRSFLTKTARSQHQTIMSFQDPFKYLTVVQIAQLVDTLSRNEVLTGNEFRTGLGFKPSSDPSADELRNKNLIDANNFDSSGEEAPTTVSTDDGQEMTLKDVPLSQLDYVTQ
jgi:hypothetical protein